MTIKVKCINDNFSKVIDELTREANGLPLTFPTKGETYTIRETFDNDGLITSYLLNELYNPVFYIPVIKQRRELSFAEWRFEQVLDDISIEVEEKVHALH
jgi:hypothetical protein